MGERVKSQRTSLSSDMINLYNKGVRKERRVVNEYRAKGWISFRSAGSHSPIDVVAIDPQSRMVKIFQCKGDKMPQSQKDKLYEAFKAFPGQYTLTFDVV